MASDSWDSLHPSERDAFRVDAESGCWVWQRKINKAGYPHAHAHRRIYKKLVGPIPDGHQLHHVCENTACVNPQHLRPITLDDHLEIHHLEAYGRSRDQIEAVRADRAGGTKYWDLVAKYDVPYATIYAWCNYAWGGQDIPLPERVCERHDCDNVIISRRPDRRFCSARCRGVTNGRKARERAKELP